MHRPQQAAYSPLPPAAAPAQPAEAEAESHSREAEWFKKHHPADGAMRQKAVDEKQRLAAAAAATAGQWKAIGPQPILSGSTTYSGRVWGIGVDPRNSKVVYIGTDGGGVWGTTDGGTNWAPLTDSQANINIRDLTLAPSAPDTILAATYGGGVLKSTNDGATWTVLHPSSGDTVYSVSVHPTNASIMLAGGCQEISRSADGGNTWTTTLSTTNDCWGFQQVVFDPTNGNIAYAAMGDGLHRSTDGGNTWNLVGGAGLPAGPFGYVTVAIAPSSTNILYLALKGSNGLTIGFYRSTDSGATWTQVGTPVGDADYWGWSLRVHPTNPNLIYAGCVALSMSADGGNTWVENDSGVHVDDHVQTYSADGSILYIGNDGGIWSTTTPTSQQPTWTSLNNTLNTVLFYPGISINPLSLNIAFGGTQDNGLEQYRGNLEWIFTPPCGDAGYSAIDFVQPQNVYVACAEINVQKSTDGGNTFAGAQNGIDVNDNSNFIQPLVMDPSNSNRLYFGTSRVYQTLDGANSWTAISPNLTTGAVFSAIAVAPSDPNTVYAGIVYSGIVYITRNALAGSGATWSEIDLPFQEPLTQIAVDPQNPLTAWAAVTGPTCCSASAGLVFGTTNGGATWTNLSAGLPNVTVSDLLLDPDIANTMYAATDIGVYRSVDGGQSWLPLGSGLPNVIVHSIRLDRPTRTLRAATYGRGVWDLSVPTTGQVAITISSNPPGAPFSLEDGSVYVSPFSFYWYIGAQHTVTWLLNPPGATNATYVFQNWSDSSTANPRTITVPTSAATYTANLAAQYLLTTAVYPASTGTIVVSPTSADGFYNSGQVVTITAIPTAGYGFFYFIGNVSAPYPSPQTITMSAPNSVTARFYCQFSPFGLPTEVGPGPVSAMLIWAQGAGCQSSGTSDSPWLVLGPQTASNGLSATAYSIAQNTGGSRQANVTFTGDLSTTFQLTQDAAGSFLPNISSVSPVSGTAAAQVFTVEAYDAGGFARIGPVYFAILGLDALVCELNIIPAHSAIRLGGDTGQSNGGYVTLPGSAVLQNNECQLNAATSSISGSGNTLTVNLGLSFNTAFAGPRYIMANAVDSAASLSGPLETLGTWYVSAGPPALTVAKTADSATVAAGSPIGFTVTTGNSNAAGIGAATGVTLSDPLPAGTGINWSISPAYNGPGTCAITGAAGSQTLNCTMGNLLPGATASVHIASSTSPASCQAYSNTATLSADGISPLQASATSTVQCPALTISGPAWLPTGAVGVSYFPATITATGGTGSYTWSALGLPNGLSIASGTGVITGTPTTAAGSPFTVTITVGDTDSASAHNSFSLAVVPSIPCDVKQTGSLSVADVQLVINQALGTSPAVNDLNGDGAVNVADLQIEINAALGGGCSAQ